MTWRRDEIDLGQRFATEDSGSIYEVVAISDQPTVVLRLIHSRTGVTSLSDLHYVIGSPDFARWSKVRYEGPQSDAR